MAVRFTLTRVVPSLFVFAGLFAAALGLDYGLAPSRPRLRSAATWASWARCLSVSFLYSLRKRRDHRRGIAEDAPAGPRGPRLDRGGHGPRARRHPLQRAPALAGDARDGDRRGQRADRQVPAAAGARATEGEGAGTAGGRRLIGRPGEGTARPGLAGRHDEAVASRPLAADDGVRRTRDDSRRRDVGAVASGSDVRHPARPRPDPAGGQRRRSRLAAADGRAWRAEPGTRTACRSDCLACHVPFSGPSANKCLSCHPLHAIGVQIDHGAAAPTAAAAHVRWSIVRWWTRAPRATHATRALAGPGAVPVVQARPLSGCGARQLRRLSRCRSARQCPASAGRDDMRVVSRDDWAGSRRASRTTASRPTSGPTVRACHASKRPDDTLHASAGLACASCHGTQGWKPATFDHQRYFRFDGDHPSTCATCHQVAGDFKSYTCYGCHEHTPAKMQAEHRRQQGQNLDRCARCHRSADEEGAEGGERENGGERRRRQRDEGEHR